MGKTIFLDASCGISGDMTVAALLDLGADEKKLRDTLASLPLAGYEIAVTRVKKSGIDACDFNVILDAVHENHDHDMEYLHGHSHAHVHAEEHSHIHSEVHTHEQAETQAHTHAETHTHMHEHEENHHAHHEHAHTHDHAHAHSHHGHDHGHGRGLPEITEILRSGHLTPHALELAEKIFLIVAEAESKVHARPLNEVHFHEVGAVDSIVDIAAAAICLDDLGIEHVIIPSLAEGIGSVRCQHGLLPIPVPATAAIAAAHHLPLQIGNVQGELVTPTGAAIAAAVMTGDKLPERFAIDAIGIGAGKRTYENAGILRAMLITDLSETDKQERLPEHIYAAGQTAAHPVQNRTLAQDQTPTDILKLETNVDDCTGEALGFTMSMLMDAGALDAFYTPIFMKKNRPAYLLSVLCRPEDRQRMEEIIFRHTSTIGIRRTAMQRTKLDRISGSVAIDGEEAGVKYTCYDGSVRAYPEYESVAALAKKTGAGFAEMYAKVRQEAEAKKPAPEMFR